MSRRTLAGWGWDLDDADLGAALAALGVLAPLLGDALTWRRGPIPTRPQRKNADLEEFLSARLRDEVLALFTSGALLFEMPSRAGRPYLDGRMLPAEELRTAWRQTTQILPFWKPLSLQLVSIGRFEPEWAFGILAASGAKPFFPVESSPADGQWTWPLQVGVLGSESRLKDALTEQASRENSDADFRAHWLDTLTVTAADPFRCDLLVSEKGPHELLVEATDPRFPDCRLIVSLTAATRDGILNARALARATGASVALVRDQDREPMIDRIREWFRTLVRELSHKMPLISALHQSPHLQAYVIRPGDADVTPLDSAIAGLSGALDAYEVATGTNAIQAAYLPAADAETLRSVRAQGRDDGYFVSEYGEASLIARIEEATRQTFHRAERQIQARRVIRASVFADHDPPVNGFVAGHQHTVEVSIGLPDPALLNANEDFPIERLPPEPRGHRLSVVMTEPDLLPEPLVRVITLPAFGDSSVARFDVEVPVDQEHVRARITVLHRGRILQIASLTADLLATVEPGGSPTAELSIVAALRPGLTALEERRTFQAALVLNHASDVAAATLVADDRVDYIPLRDATDATEVIGRIFEDSERDGAFGRRLDQSDQWLRKLAIQGRLLYDAVGQRLEQLATDGHTLRRLQVVMLDPRSHIPIEVVYDLPAPANDAVLCPNWESAIEAGRCDDRYHKHDVQGLLNVVCPSGFWGLTKVIERHDFSTLEGDYPRAAGHSAIGIAGPSRDVNRLAGLSPVLFATSDVINGVDPQEGTRVTEALKGLVEQANGRFRSVRTWNTWSKSLKARVRPQVLVLLSHTKLDAPNGPSLEIAAVDGGQVTAIGQINKHHVNPDESAPGPLVMLLGCDTAVVPQGTFASAVGRFVEGRAGVVVGTISPVLGRHAGRVAEAVLAELQSSAQRAANADGAPIGESMMIVRRHLFSTGMLVSLALTSYGDADWRVPANA